MAAAAVLQALQAAGGSNRHAPDSPSTAHPPGSLRAGGLAHPQRHPDSAAAAAAWRADELGWLLRRIQAATAELETLRSVVHEAVVAAVKRELGSYYRLLAILQAQARLQVGGSGCAAPTDGGADVLSLRRLHVWLAEPLGRLRVLAECLEVARSARGGQLISALHALAQHGEPLARKVVCPVLEEACAPYFKQVVAWVLNGAVDSGRQFMVVKEQLVPQRRNDPAAVWRAGYRLDATMQPGFLPDQLAADIFTTGKTIAFLREWCSDTCWAAAISTATQQLASAGGAYQQLRWLETVVGEVKEAVSSRLLDIVIQQQGLSRHLDAIKRFLLLGQGDFVRVLLDAAAPELDKSAKDVSQYTLQGHLDAALRSSSAAYEGADILRRIDVHLPQGKTLEGDLGWDIFSLQYHVEGPLRAVLSTDAMLGYLRIFRLLWDIKHVDVVLERCWSAINATQRALNTLRGQERLHGVAVDNAELVPPLLRAFHARRAEMASFVTSLQYYVIFEVLEPNWVKLTAMLPKAADLDAVIGLHEGTLQAIATGMFLDGLPHTLTPLGLGGAGAADVQAGLRKTLRAVLDVQGPIRRLAAIVEQAVVQQALYVQRAQDSEAAGEWNAEVYNSPSISADLLQEVSNGMGRVHALFDRHLHTFLTLLPAQSHSLDLFVARFVGVIGTQPV